MVVHYASGGEGSWTSIFTTLPRILVKMEGSVLPHITPQLLIVAGLGIVASVWNPLAGDADDDDSHKLQPALSVVGILLSFLMVFKTQNAFGQFWEASRDIQDMLSCTRHLCRLIVTSFDWTDNEGHSEKEREATAELRRNVKKALRLLVLHFFAVVEYFQRTGDEETNSMEFETMMTLRSNIRKLSCGSEADFSPEFKALYQVDEALRNMRHGLAECPDKKRPRPQQWKDAVKNATRKEKRDKKGNVIKEAGTCCGEKLDPDARLASEIIDKVVEQETKDLLINVVPACNPVEVLFWTQLVVKRLSRLSRAIAKDESTKSLLGIEPPLEGQFYAAIDKIEALFSSMDLVDKTQFPFPYSQIMKILLYFWMLASPFVLEIDCGTFTPAVMVLIGIGFFGLDEVAEILESPFGNDPNDIDLMISAESLVEDVEMLFAKADVPITPVFIDEREDHKHFFRELDLDTSDRRGMDSDDEDDYARRNAPSRTRLVPTTRDARARWKKVQGQKSEIAAMYNSRPDVVVQALQRRSGTPPGKRPAEALPPAQP